MLSIFIFVKNMGDYLEMENDIFFSYSPYICRGDSAQRIFVKACAWLCPFQESYLLPRKVQCMKKSYMKGRKEGGLVLVGFLTQIHEIL